MHLAKLPERRRGFRSASAQPNRPSHQTGAIAGSAGSLGERRASDTTARVWDGATGRALAVLRAHYSAINSVAVTADGCHVVTGSRDKSARVWNLASGRELMVQVLGEDFGAGCGGGIRDWGPWMRPARGGR